MARTLLDGKRALLTAAVLGALLGVTAAKLMPRTYKSTIVLKFEGTPTLPGGTPVGPGAVNIAAEAIHAAPVLGTLKRRLHLPGRLDVIEKGIEVTPDAINGLLRITTSADSARGASLRVATLSDVVLGRLRELEGRRFGDAQRSLAARTAAQERELAIARSEYDAFRDTHGIADLSTEQEQGIASAAELRAQRDLGEAEIHALEARVTQLRRDSARAPRMVTTSASASAERTELQRLESELATARGSLSDDHPRVRALELQVGGLRRRIQSGRGDMSLLTYGASGQFQELQTSLSTAEAELAAARERMNGLRDLASRAQTRVSEFSQIEGEAATLLAKVRVNETLSAELHDQLARVENAARQGDSGFRVLTPPQTPENPERSSKKLLVAAAMPSAFVLLVALILLVRELRGLRVKTARELAYWGRAPVVASTTWPRDLHGLDDLIGDMDDCAPAAHGRTLIVGVTESQGVLAQTIASRLGEDWRNTVVSMPGVVPPSWRPGATTRSNPPSTPRSSPPPIPRPASGAPGDAARDRRDSSFARKATVIGYSSPLDEGTPEAGSRPTFSGHESPIPEPIQLPPTAIAPRWGLPAGLVPYRDVEPWDGPGDGPSLRRAARLADRVAVVVPAGGCSVLDLATLSTRLGRTHGVGFILVDVPAEYARLADRSGPVDAFWAATRVD